MIEVNLLFMPTLLGPELLPSLIGVLLPIYFPFINPKEGKIGDDAKALYLLLTRTGQETKC
jgi:hypothetical protein